MLKYTVFITLFIILASPSKAKKNNLQDIEQLKIEYIKNLLRFTELQNYNNKTTNINFCIIGKYKKYSYFDSLSTHKNKFRIKYNPASNKLNSCEAIYIPYDERKKLKLILKKVSNLPILTIGERDMGWHGAIIAIYKKRNTLSFSVNLKALNKSQIKINYQILDMGYLIEE